MNNWNAELSIMNGSIALHQMWDLHLQPFGDKS